MRERKYPEAVWFDILFTLVILTFFIWSLIDYKTISLFTSIVFMLIGSAFLYCRKYKEVSYIEKVLFWIADNVPTIRFESNHIFFGLFIIAIGICSAILPSNRDFQREELLWGKLRGSPSFWLTLALIVLLNLMFGLYNYYKKKIPVEVQKRTVVNENGKRKFGKPKLLSGNERIDTIF